MRIKRVSFGPLIRFHKVLVLLSIVLPLSMVMISYGGHLRSDLFEWSESSRAWMHGETEAISPAAEPSDSPFRGEAANQLPTLPDVVFYFVNLILLFSITGLLIFALRYAFQAWRMSKVIKDGVVSTISPNFSLIESMTITSPFSVGILRKSIFTPKNISEFDKQVIIQHELNHFRCRHHLWSLLEAVLACVFWFNPIAHVMRRHGAFLRELECDGRTVHGAD